LHRRRTVRCRLRSIGDETGRVRRHRMWAARSPANARTDTPCAHGGSRTECGRKSQCYRRRRWLAPDHAPLADLTGSDCRQTAAEIIVVETRARAHGPVTVAPFAPALCGLRAAFGRPVNSRAALNLSW